MKIVAILLCLVLATSSIVSTTLAKFVVRKDATTSITFDTFGIVIDVDASGIGTPQVTNKGDSASITYDSLEMRPGMTKDNVLRFYLTENKVDVPVDLVVTVDVTIDPKCFVTDNNLVGDTDTAFMPISFRVGTVNSKTATSWDKKGEVPYQTGNDIGSLESSIETLLAQEIAVAMGLTKSDATDNSVTKSVAKNTAITFADGKQGISFGFYWDLDNDPDNDTNDLVETHLATILKDSTPISITYTISAEQNAAA